MKSVKVLKSDLKASLLSNKKIHKIQFEKAYEGYVNTCMSVLTENLKSFKEKKPTSLVITERAPENHTADYDRALKMLEMSVEDVIEISKEEFTQLVQDDWSWKKSWGISNSKYLGYGTLETE